MTLQQFLVFLTAVFIQLVGLLGGFFILSFILSELQRIAQKNYMRSFGWRSMLWTGWVGVPVHELGHIFFAKVFGHKIEKISLFKPNKETGVMGEVGDSYNALSPYQVVGNFFIGFGPTIFGSIALAALMYFALPNHSEVFANLSINELSVSGVAGAVYSTITDIFNFKNLLDPIFWIFLYISFSIASHMAPSRQDLKRAAHGLVAMAFLLILLNLILLFFGLDPSNYILQTAAFISGLFAFQVYAIAVSLLNLALSALLLLLRRR